MKVLVIGGGMAGVAACVGIRSYVASSTEIVLIEPKDHVEICWAAYRALFDKEMAKSSLYPLDTFCSKHNVLHIMATVTHAQLSTPSQQQQQSVTLDNGTTIDDFDACVICTGAANPYKAFGRGGSDVRSISRRDRLEALHKEGQALLKAKTVIIVGGGLVGAELAGDIAVYSRDNANSTRVIIIHAGERLCHKELGETASKMLQEKLAELGVKSILNEKGILNEDGNSKKVTLESTGQVLDCDIVVQANGIRPTNHASFVEKQYCDDKGWIEVDEYFRVKGAAAEKGTLFAFGDCCSALPDTGNSIVNNVSVIGYNVKGVLDVKESGKEPWLSKHAGHSEVYICTVGPEDGVAQTSLFSLDTGLPAWKNYTMFLYDARSKLGLEQEEDQKC